MFGEALLNLRVCTALAAFPSAPGLLSAWQPLQPVPRPCVAAQIHCAELAPACCPAALLPHPTPPGPALILRDRLIVGTLAVLCTLILPITGPRYGLAINHMGLTFGTGWMLAADARLPSCRA